MRFNCGWADGQFSGDLGIVQPRSSALELHARARLLARALAADWLSTSGRAASGERGAPARRGWLNQSAETSFSK